MYKYSYSKKDWHSGKLCCFFPLVCCCHDTQIAHFNTDRFYLHPPFLIKCKLGIIMLICTYVYVPINVHTNIFIRNNYTYVHIYTYIYIYIHVHNSQASEATAKNVNLNVDQPKTEKNDWFFVSLC